MYTVDEIIHLWEEDKITTEEANRHLAEIGSRVRLDDTKESGWTEEEMKEGFITGKPGEPVQRELDRSRRMDMAGKTAFQKVNGKIYKVWYNEDGYFQKAVRAKK